jgi:hypothetical protein
MSLNAATLRLLAEKGLSATDIVEVAEAMEVRRDPTAAERMRRHRAKNAAKPVTRNVTVERYAVTPPYDNNTSTPPVPQSPDGDCPPLAEKVVSAWNAMATANGLDPARKLNPGRVKHLAARVKEHGEAAIFEAITKLGLSDWHCGRKPGSDWKANLGWLLKSPENFQKILEREGSANGTTAKPADPDAFRAFALTSAERCRTMGREQEALDWEAKARGEEPRRASTGPPRSIAALIPEQLKLAANR